MEMAMGMYSHYYADAIMVLEGKKDDTQFIASVLKSKTSQEKFRSDKPYRDYIHGISHKMAEILPGILNGTKCNDTLKIEILENFMENNRGIISFLNLFNALRRDTSSQWGRVLSNRISSFFIDILQSVEIDKVIDEAWQPVIDAQNKRIRQMLPGILSDISKMSTGDDKLSDVFKKQWKTLLEEIIKKDDYIKYDLFANVGKADMKKIKEGLLNMDVNLLNNRYKLLHALFKDSDVSELIKDISEDDYSYAMSCYKKLEEIAVQEAEAKKVAAQEAADKKVAAQEAAEKQRNKTTPMLWQILKFIACFIVIILIINIINLIIPMPSALSCILYI